jgi:lipid-A-disaccharide synthase
VQGIGGSGMAAAGMPSRFPMSELSVMGLAEVLPRLPALIARIRETARAVVAAAPDALVTIDSPDFCLRVARKVRAARPDIRTIHYVAPTVWAWRPGRAKKMARHVDHVLALFPFEPPYMEAAGMSCDFVGHPVATASRASAAEITGLRAALGLGERPFLVLLPGSRVGEVTRMAPVFAEVLTRLRAARPDLAGLVPAAAGLTELVRRLMPPDADGQPIVLDPAALPDAEAEMWKRAAFAGAEAALAASGTVSLELAAQDTPMVIAYAANPLTAAIARRLVRIDTATMVNIVTETRAVPEFLFENCRADAILPAVARLLDDPEAAAAQRHVSAEAMRRLGRGEAPPGLRAARSVLSVLGR